MRTIFGKKMKLGNFSNNKVNIDNKGFSIVELLVAVAILAIVFVPTLKSFTTATITNSKAQSVQNATSLAEVVMEKVKSTSINALYDEAVNTGTMISNYTVGVDDILFLSDSDSSESSTFVNVPPFHITYSGITATQGQTFDADVIISADEYSESNNASASDANSFQVPVFKQVDSTKHMVLSWEINSMDLSAVGNIIDENVLDIKKIEKSKGDIIDSAKKNGVKTVKILLDNQESDGIKATCNVEYDAQNSIYKKTVDYLVYTGYFKELSDSGSDIGPNIYLFYSTMRGAGAENIFRYEKIFIEDNTGKQHDIYLILQNGLDCFQDNGDTTKLINIQMITKMKAEEPKLIPSNPTDGIIPISTSLPTKLYTNLNVGVNGVSNFYDKKAKNRIYSVDVNITKTGDTTGAVYANLHSTMGTGDEANN